LVDSIEEQREIIRHSLHEIVDDIGMAMRDAGLHFPVFMTVRDNGDSLATIATPLDPSEDDWERASAIVCQIIEKKIGGGRLRSRGLPCAVANAAPMSAADVTADSAGLGRQNGQNLITFPAGHSCKPRPLAVDRWRQRTICSMRSCA
jgi:hypothetical protein